MKLSDDDRRKLLELERLLALAADGLAHSRVDPALFPKIEEALGSWPDDDRPELAKLADLRKHLAPDMTLRTLQNVQVPVERALKRAVADDDFLIRREDRPEPAREKIPLVLVLDHLRSSFNVGSLFRTAEGLGLEKIYLGGYTPSPEEAKSAKAALGSELRVPWDAKPTKEILLELKERGYRLIALETAGTAKSLNVPFEKTKTALILGNERFGLEADVLALCDEVRELPLAGTKNSLNVAVLGAIAAYEWKSQWSR